MNDPGVRLARPVATLREQLLEALPEYHAEGRHLDWDTEELERDFAGFVNRVRSFEDPANPRPGFVQQTTFWLMDGQEYVGRLSLRHTLNDGLRLEGGNIGYDIRPSRRRQGYGTRILALGLEEARKIGLERVLVTCDSDNTGSRRIIEANGGVFEGESVLENSDMPVRRYWIEL